MAVPCCGKSVFGIEEDGRGMLCEDFGGDFLEFHDRGIRNIPGSHFSGYSLLKNAALVQSERGNDTARIGYSPQTRDFTGSDIHLERHCLGPDEFTDLGDGCQSMLIDYTSIACSPRAAGPTEADLATRRRGPSASPAGKKLNSQPIRTE